MRTVIRLILLVGFHAVLCLSGCGGDSQGLDDAGPQVAPRIQMITSPTPLLPGSPVVVRGADFDLLGPRATLSVELANGLVWLTQLAISSDQQREWLVLGVDTTSSNVRVFEWDDEAAQRADTGTNVASASLSGLTDSDGFSWSFDVAELAQIALNDGFSGTAHRNDTVVLNGSGFLLPSEGTVVARVEGMFVRRGQSSGIPVDARLPVRLLELRSRMRGQVVLSTALGGAAPGTLTGTVSLERTRNGMTETTPTRPVALDFAPPELYSFDGAAASLGRLITVNGAGFLGGTESETTLFALQGTFTPRDGTAQPFTGDLVPRFVSGTQVRVPVEIQLRENMVVSRLSGAARGVFEGTATPVVFSGSDEFRGSPVPLRLSLGPVVQPVYIRFLPGWYVSLANFGLATAADRVAQRIQERIESIYGDYSIDVRLERPADFDSSAYTTVEIGGPDPNGNGLFGYDNSPGKDVGNLRMADSIGGANAATQADGYPGYGGVFVESMLYWSSHPDLPGGRPARSPDPDPLFDEIFDPVRLRPATRAEVEGEGTPERLDAVDRAIFALGSIVGETTSHELGHSFGMAQPYGSLTAFHNTADGDGCLMDSGGARTVGERAAEPGFPETHFCYDEPMYLMAILGTE